MKGYVRINPPACASENAASPVLEVQLSQDRICFFDSSVELRCRKAGLAVSKHYKVYGRPHCGRCGGRITVCRLGENSRMTYFCPHCQREDAHQAEGGQPPTRSAAARPAPHGDRLGDHVARRWEEAWTCGTCTLINMPSAQARDACLAPRPAECRRGNEGSPAALGDAVKFPCSGFGKPGSEVKINRRTAFGTTTLVLTDFSQKPGPSGGARSPDGLLLGGEPQSPLPTNVPLRDPPRPSEERAPSTAQPPGRASLPAAPAFSASGRPACKRLRAAPGSPPACGRHSPGLPNGGPQMDTTDGACASMAPAPRCSQHRRLCVLRVVSKNGENKGRPFYTCPLPREAQCGFFQWADLSFPFCNHGKRSILRTVLKMGPNNGKKFFVCPLGKEAQCPFFQWAARAPSEHCSRP